MSITDTETKHPAACPYCGGTIVNAVMPDVRLRYARLEDGGTITISDVDDDGTDWKFGDMLHCHTCSSTYLLPAEVKRDYTSVDSAVYEGVKIPRRGEPGYIGADVTWRPVQSKSEFAMTFTVDAWEFFYDLIRRYAEQGLVVRIDDGPKVSIERIEGEMYDNPSNAVLVVIPAEGEDRTEKRVPMFDDNGECAIWKATVL